MDLGQVGAGVIDPGRALTLKALYGHVQGADNIG
jgi:hypothetical protein